MKPCAFIITLFFMLPCCCAAQPQNQVFYWDRYWQDSNHSPIVSASTRSLVPKNALVQADFQADWNGAEEITAYAVPVGQLQSRPYILFSRNGHVVQRIDLLDLAPAGPVEFRAAAFFQSGALKAVFFAFGLGADQAGIYFFAVTSRNGKHPVIWRSQAGQGRIELAESLAGFSLWKSCCIEQDPLNNNCVWCDHRYEVIDFRWRHGVFEAVKMRKTREHLNPEPFAQKPIIFSTTQ